MEYRRLYILVEGNDDERFVERIIKPEFEKKYHSVQVYRYAAQTPQKIENFIKSIIAMKANYMILTDIDHSPCVTHRKKLLKAKKIKNRLVGDDKIIVVIKEIESWYLAGLDQAALKKLGISYHDKGTDTLTKEQFDRLISAKYVSRIDFMQEILENFRLETAKQNNKSFKYFIRKQIPSAA
ncbi:MAG: DUF4276 family protein [Candidatus Aminicenantes bacterium]|nr:DUF4276 family protein [Candidatus Aminicenantes bacterium]NIM83610.1 DUF4276 family protein [Candidatus Aminicenantes bacterium]NIN23014.1 DUF4276 family protein [Candidatus Aminicenantes bacterium]NIN46751.1 DUF4276 family protein [Candidatus Aminicenantes bacterium]NIN89658.1 DUF4276 family protein [Candidatus Aminicenantes bacterium]